MPLADAANAADALLRLDRVERAPQGVARVGRVRDDAARANEGGHLANEARLRMRGMQEEALGHRARSVSWKRERITRTRHRTCTPVI